MVRGYKTAETKKTAQPISRACAGDALWKVLVKSVNDVNVPRGEHHSIGVAEKAIQDLSNMMRCMLADSNVPNI